MEHCPWVLQEWREDHFAEFECGAAVEFASDTAWACSNGHSHDSSAQFFDDDEIAANPLRNGFSMDGKPIG